MNTQRSLFLSSSFVLLVAVVSNLCGQSSSCAAEKNPNSTANRIQPYKKNPWYWQYQGKPIMLYGGSKDDNLFQLPDLKKHLDEIKASGGNVIRNTMSDRHDIGFEIYAYKKLANGKYDLKQWNEKYWKNFENMLRWTQEREIIVQIEIFDRFDVSQKYWEPHPYNPKNNVNYTYQQSGFAKHYPHHPGANRQPFYTTIPTMKNNQLILAHQIRFVNKMLSYSLRHPHVLYCMDNETRAPAKWAHYWIKHVRDQANKVQAKKAAVTVYCTDMRDDWNPMAATHREVFDRPKMYDFVDISQNNQIRGQQHWDNLQAVRKYLSKHPRPMNHTKTYGAEKSRFGKSQDALERFWENIIGGAASSRFHRPPAGLGLSSLSKKHIRSARMLSEKFDFLQAEPDAGNKLLTNRQANEAFLTVSADKQYAIYLPTGGDVRLQLPKIKYKRQVQWLEIEKSRWTKPLPIKNSTNLSIKAPGKGHWIALVVPVEKKK